MRKFVSNPIILLANGDHVFGMQELFDHSQTVDLDAVSTLKISNFPITLLENKLAMNGGTLGFISNKTPTSRDVTKFIAKFDARL